MKAYKLIETDSKAVVFEADFIPTAIAFTSMDRTEHGGRYLRRRVPSSEVVAKAIAENGSYDFKDGQTLVKS